MAHGRRCAPPCPLTPQVHTAVPLSPRPTSPPLRCRSEEPSANTIDVFPMQRDGRPARRAKVNESTRGVTFAITFDKGGGMLVAEAEKSKISTYRMLADGSLEVAPNPLANGQKTLCWLERARRRLFFGRQHRQVNRHRVPHRPARPARAHHEVGITYPSCARHTQTAAHSARFPYPRQRHGGTGRWAGAGRAQFSSRGRTRLAGRTRPEQRPARSCGWSPPAARHWPARPPHLFRRGRGHGVRPDTPCSPEECFFLASDGTKKPHPCRSAPLSTYLTKTGTSPPVNARNPSLPVNRNRLILTAGERRAPVRARGPSGPQRP